MTAVNGRLSVIGYSNGFTLWHYVADDPIETVLQDGYFNSVDSLVHDGDVVYITVAGDTYCRVFYRVGGVLKLKNIK